MYLEGFLDQFNHLFICEISLGAAAAYHDYWAQSLLLVLSKHYLRCPRNTTHTSEAHSRRPSRYFISCLVITLIFLTCMLSSSASSLSESSAATATAAGRRTPHGIIPFSRIILTHHSSVLLTCDLSSMHACMACETYW